ncbi:MAG: GumC family protein, partial [Geminicoccaceae bacterium]
MTSSALNSHNNPPSFEHPSSDSGSDDGRPKFDLREKIRILWRRKVLIVLTVSLITLSVALIALALPPKYVAVASILIEEGRTNVVDAQATGASVVEETTDSSTLAAELRLLRSETYARKIVEELNLLAASEFNPILQQKIGPFHVLTQRLSVLHDWLPESLFIDTGLAAFITPPVSPDTESPKLSLPSPESEAYEQLMQDTVANLLAGLEIKTGGSNLILIKMRAGNPKQAAQIADEVSRIYVADQLEIRRGAVDEAIDWLRDRVADLRNRVLSAEGSVADFREKHGLIDTSSTGRNVGAAGGASNLIILQAEVAAKEELLDWIGELRRQGASLQTINAVLPLPSIEQLQQRQQELDNQEALLRMKYGVQHREIIQLNNGRHQINFQRQQVEVQIKAEIDAGVQKLEGELAFAKRRKEEVGLQSQEESPSVEESPSDARAEVQLRDLERQAESARSLYIAFLNRFQEVSEQRNLLTSSATVASRAGVPAEPEFPKPMLMIFGGFTV